MVLGGAERVLGFRREWGWMNWWVVGHPGSVGGVWCVGGVENVEWGVEDGDGWRLLCGGSSVGAGDAPSDGALVVADWGGCSGDVDVGDGAM